uniref:Uncharacterized protein n=2 Tax=viral metagenome TaxID=1070528 RepID=A0A6M3K4J8_9ZZZZ
MGMTRKDVRNRLKLMFGLDPNREDSNLTDDQFNMAINDAIRTVAKDVYMIPVERIISVRDGQWEYEMPDDLETIRTAFFLDSDGQYNELSYYSLEQFMHGADPGSNKSDTPLYYSYPKYQSAVVNWFANAGIYDYISISNVTEATFRTLVDTGANFGRTRSGYRIEPGCLVYNLEDNSYGYVRVLNIHTNWVKASGVADSGTSTNILMDQSHNFEDLYVEEGDIIVVPSTGVPDSYGFVTDVDGYKVYYEDMKGLNTRVRKNDTYKVGRATEIVLKVDSPHPGLRNGSLNKFSVSETKATVTGSTVYTLTAVSGVVASVVRAPIAGDIVIAEQVLDEDGVTVLVPGGQHGIVTAVGDSSLTVDKWIGGKPYDGQQCSVKVSDSYQIETKQIEQRVLTIAPTPNYNDAPGEESIVVVYNKKPNFPEDDDDLIELSDDKYQELLLKCSIWQAARLSGRYFDNPQHLTYLEGEYRALVPQFAGDVFAPPFGKPLNVMRNRRSTNTYGRRFQARSGAVYDI